MSESTNGQGLVISGLQAGIAGKQILNGIDLRVGPGEIHAVMGPNGAVVTSVRCPPGNVLLPVCFS
jgi:ABC-type Mn2+/Zn2+ transport system ATPase subunit